MAAPLLSLGRPEDPLDDAMTAIAAFPTIVGTYWRLLHGEAACRRCARISDTPRTICISC